MSYAKPARGRDGRATAGAFGMPLLRLDMGRVFGGIVGQSASAICQSI
jgi:hypothetical protein